VNEGEETHTPTVSVIVPTRNSAATLDDCLASIRAQTYASVELIVVDNQSQDATVEIAGKYADKLEHAGPERSAQRNHGARVATGEYLAIIDSDMVLSPDVVSECISTADREHADAVIIPERSVGEGFWAACKALERSCYVGDETVEAARFYSRTAFEKFGGYDEEMTGPEDWDLPARMRGAVRFGRIDPEIVHLEGRLTLRGSVRKKFYYGRQFGDYIRRHPDLARQQLRFVRPAFVRHRRRLVRTPLLAGGMLLMKTAELTAGAAGLLGSRALSRLDRRRPRSRRG
jgi:glycosyltransferase involved in cell wall biosynthesis